MVHIPKSAHRISIAIFHGFLRDFKDNSITIRYVFAVFVHIKKNSARIGIAIFRRFRIPLYCKSIILRYAFATIVHIPKIVHCNNIALFRCHGKYLQCPCEITLFSSCATSVFQPELTQLLRAHTRILIYRLLAAQVDILIPKRCKLIMLFWIFASPLTNKTVKLLKLLCALTYKPLLSIK